MINEMSAWAFCKEDISKIENYEEAVNDKSQCWDCHHRTEIWWNCYSQELIDNECYYHRPAKELIFLKRTEHRRLHNMNMSEETRIKINESRKGKTHSEETRRKMSEAHKGIKMPKSACDKISKAVKGHKYTVINGVRVRNKEAE